MIEGVNDETAEAKRDEKKSIVEEERYEDTSNETMSVLINVGWKNDLVGKTTRKKHIEMKTQEPKVCELATEKAARKKEIEMKTHASEMSEFVVEKAARKNDIDMKAQESKMSEIDGECRTEG